MTIIRPPALVCGGSLAADEGPIKTIRQVHNLPAKPG